MCRVDPKFKQDLSLSSTPSSSTSSTSLTLDVHSPKEGILVSSDPTSLPDDTVPSDITIKEEIATPGPSGDFPSPSASPVSESSFPKISEVYHSTEEPYITDTMGTEPSSVAAVSPNHTYPVPSTINDTASSYYVSYSGSSYPSVYNTSTLSNPADIYTNSCLSPNYLGAYPTAATGKGYPWPTATPGYSTFSMTPDMYQYQAQTYQQMAASRATYPGYFTGQTASLPNTMS